MLRDIAIGYQEGGAGLPLRSADRLPRAAGGHEHDRRHELQHGLPRPSDGDAAAAVEGQLRRVSAIGTKASLEQNAHDVTAFLAWAADPTLNTRKQLGWQVMLYLFITTVLLYLGKKPIWSKEFEITVTAPSGLTAASI